VHQGDVLVGTEAQEIGAGDEGEHCRLRDASSARGAGHVEGVGDDGAGEPQTVPQQSQDPRAQCGGEIRIQCRHEKVGRHHRSHPCLDRGRERHELALGQEMHARVDARQC
jgi:hypothetical protein